MLVRKREGRAKNIKTPEVFGQIDLYKSYVASLLRKSDYYVFKNNKLFVDTRKKKQVYREEIKFLQDRKEYLQSKIVLTLYEKRSLSKTLTMLSHNKEAIAGLESGLVLYIDFPTFKEILKTHNEELQDRLILGDKFRISPKLGYLEIREISRNFGKKRVDFGETNKRKRELLKQGYTKEDLYHVKDNPESKLKYVVYYLDDSYSLVYWVKGKFPNCSVYNFKPSNGQKGKGFKNNISKTLKEKPFLKSLYNVISK